MTAKDVTATSKTKPVAAEAESKEEELRIPAWLPEGPDFEKLDAAARWALAEQIEPAYRQLVLDPQDALEQGLGDQVVFLMWMERLKQLRLRNELPKPKSFLPRLRDQIDVKRETEDYFRLADETRKSASLLLRVRSLQAKNSTQATDALREPSSPPPAAEAAIIATKPR